MNQAQAFERFQLSLDLRNLAPRTKKIYIYWLKRFFHYVGTDDISTITIFDGQDFLRWLIDNEDYAPRTHNQAVYALRQFYEAVLLVPITSRQLPKIRPPKVDKPFFTFDQVLLLLEQCPDPRLKAVIALAAGCGLRINEITSLQWKDIHRSSHTLEIRLSKGDHTRFVPYSDTVAAILNEYALASCTGRVRRDAFIFAGKKPGDHIRNTTLTRQFSEYIQAFPFSLPAHTFHSLRHSFATQMAMRGVPLPEIQKIMGHASAATTANYIHTPDSLSDKLPDILDRKGDTKNA